MQTSSRTGRPVPVKGTASAHTEHKPRVTRSPMKVVAAAAVAVGSVVASACSGGTSHASTASTTTTTTPKEPAPVLSPIKAVFDQPAFSTYYSEDADAAAGATFTWSVSIPDDAACASGFKPGTPQPDRATWFHGDAPDGGPCVHNADTYDSSGHHATVTVIVTTTHWRCTATYDGTITGTGPAPSACTQI